MRTIRALFARMLGRRPPDHDLDAELRSHVDMHTADNVRAGMTLEEARRRALVALGGVESTKERVRDRLGAPLLSSMLQDLHFAVRLLRRSPIFAITAVLILAVGIGLTTAVFTVANWAILRPLPGVAHPEDVSIVGVGTWSTTGSLRVSGVSYPNYHDIATRLKTAAIAGYQPAPALIVMRDGHSPRPVTGQYVTASFFQVLGIGMAAGRPFTSQEDTPGSVEPVVVISDRLWMSMFDRDPSTLGQQLRINGQVFTIVGIAGGGFRGLERLAHDDLWLPGASYSLVNQRSKINQAERTRGIFYQFAVRLSPSATWTQVEAELQSFAGWLAAQYPEANERFTSAGFHLVGPLGASFFSGRDRVITLTGVMMGISVLVMLIACANVAGLLMTRGLGRTHEVAVRKAIGGGTWRLLQQHVIEGLVLWLAGGAVGILLVWGASRAVAGSPLPWLRVREADIPLDWRVLVFATGVSLAVGLLFSILPALRALRAEAADTLRKTGATISRPSFATGTALTIFQLAASLTLLVGATLLMATLRHLAAVDLGFTPSNVWAFRAAPGSVGYSESRVFDYYRKLTSRLSANEGIASTAVARFAPFFMATRTTTRIKRYADAGDQTLHAPYEHRVLSPRYFETVGIRMVRGRDFFEAEIGGPGRPGAPVVVLSESLARSLFGGVDVIGESVEFQTLARRGLRHEVIGVVMDVRQFEVTGDRPQLVYDVQGPTEPYPASAVIVVSANRPMDMGSEVRAIAASLNPALPIADVTPLTVAVENATADWTVLTKLTGFLAAVATVLAVCGLYGVVAFGVLARQREFSIRRALGATDGHVRYLALQTAAVIVCVGVTHSGSPEPRR